MTLGKIPLVVSFLHWKSPHSVCQMLLLYLCQWHTFCGLWCVSISPLYSDSIQYSITAGYFKRCSSLWRAVSVVFAITVPAEHTRHYPEVLCPPCCSCWPLTQARLVAILTVVQTIINQTMARWQAHICLIRESSCVWKQMGSKV